VSPVSDLWSGPQHIVGAEHCPFSIPREERYGSPDADGSAGERVAVLSAGRDTASGFA